MQFISDATWPKNEAGNYRKWCYRSTRVPQVHYHDHHELFWVERGCGNHFINGEKQRLAAGDLVWIRAEDCHCYAAEKTGEFLEFINVAFRKNLWQKLKDSYFPQRRSFDAEENYEHRYHRLSRTQMARLGVLAEDLRNGHTDELAVGSFLLGAHSMLTKRKSLNREPAPDWLRFATEQIGQHPNFVAGSAAFVRLAGRSPEHVARVCRKHFGKRPIDFVNEARMHYAAGILRDSSIPICEIAFDCGVENLGHFYKLFRSHHGLSPAAYRSNRTEISANA